MNSKDEHKDPLEQFFKKKAEEYDISYREEDWLNMEKKLDRRQAAKTRQRRTYFAAAAVLLIISAMGYFIYDNSNKIDQLNRQLEDNMTADVLPDSVREDTAKEQEAPPQINREMLADIPQETPESTETTDDATPEAQPEKQDQQVVVRADPVSVAGDELARAELRSVSYSELMNVNEDLSISSGNTIPGDPGYLASVSYGQAAVPPTHIHQHDLPGETALSRFEFGLIVSPDISTIGGISNFHEPGYKLGATAGYRINDRFTISGGLIHSSVKYSSGSQYYDPPAYWNPGAAPSGIRAECFILDIPITLKYDVMQFENSRFFATGGLSSYVMLSEDYWFDYDGYTPGQVTTQNERTGKTHMFSNAGFSIGYEYDLHQNWSLKAEPFIKVPLREVGWGNVKLYTLGTFVSVSYKL